MASSFFLVAVATLVALSSLASVPDGVSAAGPGNGTAEADEFLKAHNAARAELGVSPLRWSADLTSNASSLVGRLRDRSRCAFANPSSVGYGANQVKASFRPTPAQVVASWVAEKRWYVHANNSCVGGHQCGTFTQVVWRGTEEVGCAQAVCSGGSSITICLYQPPGNVVGEKPY